ncbi:MAG TPA: redoxin domain-containing protein [Gemmatimonadaceae bacterium]|jgi:peroxiredoxin Q/BCP
MEAYRDQYAKLFNGGKKVVVVAMSADPDTALASWAHDESFPVLFASDPNGEIGKRYGVFNDKYKLDTRVLFVIDSAGKVTYRAFPFRELAGGAYTELGTAVAKATGGGSP